MIGRKSVLGLSLLGALMLCAFTAQSAFAVEGWTTDQNSTAYTCSPTATPKEFTDAHCDHKGEPKNFGHELIPVGKTTAIEVTNSNTSEETTKPTKAVLHSNPFGISFTITAEEVSGSGWIENVGSGTSHEIVGTVTTVYRKLTVDDEIGPCEVVGGAIEFPAKFHSVHKANGEMGLEYTPDESTAFVEFTVNCALLGEIPIEVRGSAVGVGASPTSSNSGATQIFKAANEELEMEGSESTTFDATYTTRMAGGGNPISGTTVTP